MKRLESTDPATGEVIGSVPVTPPDDIPGLVARARAAHPAWAELGLDRRLEMLAPLADALEKEAERLGKLISREMGKPIKEAVGEVRACAKSTGRTLDEIRSALAPQVLEDERVRSTMHRDPFGVCAVISPWNFPLAMPHSMLLPAVAAGNAVVLKPSEMTPLVGQAYADLLVPLLPENVLLVAHGNSEQGIALVASDVDLIAFTGSRRAGKHILAVAADKLKRVILELGGKDPLIVLEDADLEKAAAFAARNSFRNAGQVCVASERILVDRKVADRFVSLLVEETGKWQLGNGLEEGTRVGPLVSSRQRDHVLAQIGSALEGGARVLAGGKARAGNFVEPTVLVDVSPDMPIATEETFGPVACVMVVDDEDEAVRLANDTRFGLGAVIFGGDTDRTERVARRLTAGMIGVNQSIGAAPGTPWVGARESGYGFHSSPEGHRQFTQLRVVSRPR